MYCRDELSSRLYMYTGIYMHTPIYMDTYKYTYVLQTSKTVSRNSTGTQESNLALCADQLIQLLPGVTWNEGPPGGKMLGTLLLPLT